MSPATTLSEAASKALLRGYGMVTPPEAVVATAEQAGRAADEIGYPVAVKLCGGRIAHKTERHLVRLGLVDSASVIAAGDEILAAAQPDDGDVELLVAAMVTGERELIAGLVRDAQFGANVMLGIGGVLTEAIADVVFRPAPLDDSTAHEMIASLASQVLLGPFRGGPAVSQRHLADLLIGLGRLAADRPDIVSVDVNPLIIDGSGLPIAVDALVELGDESTPTTAAAARPDNTAFMALFEPGGVVVTGASTHPGKFGFVALHNLLAAGYEGAVYATHRDAEEVLGVQTLTDIDAIPDGAVDLALVCTPAHGNADLVRACARKGIRAMFVTSAGYAEAGDDGIRAQDALVSLGRQLGVLIAGPNGQGLVSTPVKLCAQIVSPYPPVGRIGVASQSGNLASSFLNFARLTGVGISRAISAGNAAAVGVADYIDFYADDPATSVGLAYVEDVSAGASMMRRLGDAATRLPLVVLKGGATAGGAQAAASHTGALAADDRLFDGACAAYGITRAHSVEGAFEAAATFATQPLPAGDNVVVLTIAGGWGVVTADAITTNGDLHLLDLPDDLRAAIDEHLPPRWSRSNPVDCVGGETRDTIATVLQLIAEHPAVDSVVFIGLGIQSNQARTMREGRFFPGHGLERIVDYHERQDRRHAQLAADLSESTGKPILCVTELAMADPDNPGPATVRATGRIAYPSGDRAVAALAHLHRYARHRDRRHT